MISRKRALTMAKRMKERNELWTIAALYLHECGFNRESVIEIMIEAGFIRT